MNDHDEVRNNRILIIDDNPSIHEDIKKILAGHGKPNEVFIEVSALLFDEQTEIGAGPDYEIDSAFQGKEGLQKVRQAHEAGRPYALAFVDVHMPPGWDGVETITRIWRDYPDLQVVICTAYSDYSWEEMIKQLGTSDGLLILKKPFDNIEVLQLAHSLTQKWDRNHQVQGRLGGLDKLVMQRTAELQQANETLQAEFAERRQIESSLHIAEERCSVALNDLRQSQKLEGIGQLTAGVAHDFNNLLAVVQGHTSLLLEGASTQSEDRAQLQTIAVAAERATKLVRQLLTFSRKQVIEFRPIRVQATLAVMSEMLRLLVGQNISVKITHAADLPLIHADAGMIEQVLMNLATNARDAMPKGGQLSIRAEKTEVSAGGARQSPQARPGRFVCLSVRDTGGGIAPEILPRIFEPFFTTKGVGKGTGLGLATVHGIVRQLGGWIEVESQPGEGSTFRVFIPAIDKENGEQSAPLANPRDAVGVVEEGENHAQLPKLVQHAKQALAAADQPEQNFEGQQ